MYESDPETGVLWLLTSDNPTGATGALVGLNVFPFDELPQDPPYPCVLYTVVSAPRGYTHDGPDGCTPFRFQIDAFDTTVKAVRRLRLAILKDLSGFKGEVPTSPPVRIFGAFADNEGDSVESSLERAGQTVKRKRLDFIVWIKE